MSTRIEDYAMIGDLSTVALVGCDGSIDWLCWPRFDSDPCFAALLGSPDNGRWLIAPTVRATSTRRYRPHTLILETRFETPEGAATLIDFMPPRTGHSHLIRIIVGEHGRVDFRSELILRFGVGAQVPWVTRLDDCMIRAVAGPDQVFFRAPARLRGEDFKTIGDVSVGAGETARFVLTYTPSHEDAPEEVAVEDKLAYTEQYWTGWAAKSDIAGPWRETVCRSLITLKALTYIRTGGLVAAATTSLPESIGGSRNWDYRFCWLRDATLTLLALMNGGYYDEARAWRDWLLRAAAGSPGQIQIMYGLSGERRLSEWEVPWLAGYEDSKPVRIGNAAHGQLQLDIFGEVMDALYQGRRGGLGDNESGWALQRALLAHLEKIWREPDEGIWEVRSGREHFTHSKAMAWLAFNRGIQSAEEFDLPGDTTRWQAIRDEIHDDVCRHGFDEKRNSFMRAYGSQELDASLLLLPAIGFLPPNDPRIRGTVEAIEREIIVDGFVLRYNSATARDGLPPGEGAFLACSFWLADAYIMVGRHEDARRLFERLLALCNDVGLLSEQYDPRGKRFLGNFPQAFSHLALVNTASNLFNAQKPAEQRSERTVGGPAAPADGG